MSPTKLLCSRTFSQVHANVVWPRFNTQVTRPAKPLELSSIRSTKSATTNIPKIVSATRQYSIDHSCWFGPRHSPAILQTEHRHFQLEKLFSNMNVPEDVFQGDIDRFRGVTIDCQNEEITDDEFATKLQKSLDFWISNKNRAIWFKIYKKQSRWVPILTQAGFDFHHARTGVVTLYRWLPTDESLNLPEYAHTLLGCGGVVINDKNEILVVSDRYTMIKNSWKLPGGYVEPNENLVEGAIREVFEETGIKSTFRSVISWRHSHGGNFGCSDIYVVIGLDPLNLDFKRCEREIAKVQWMPVDEFLQHPNVHETNRHFLRTYLDYQKRGLVLTRKEDVHQILKKKYNLYYIATEEETEKSEQKPKL